MTVHFIGAGPGAADLITLRGRDLLARCPVCLYAGSVVPRELLAHCPPGARLVDTAPLSLDEIEAEWLAAEAAGQDVARLHSGDLSIWSAVAELMNRLYPQPRPAPGIHPTAVIGEGAKLGEGVSIGPCCVIGDGAQIGAASAVGDGAHRASQQRRASRACAAVTGTRAASCSWS